jgi:hypothetical protein
MIRVTFTDGELTELISVLTFFGIGMEQAGDRKQALCSKILVR